MITVLSGGSGGAKFIQGLARVIDPKDLTVIINTGDDLTWWGLHVSPDVDSVAYALAGKLSRDRGWGLEGETFRALEAARDLGMPAWFQVGDQDLATHLLRTQLLREGKSLSEATAEITHRLGISSPLLPMTNDRVETRVLTEQGELSFQEYFVRERYRPEPLAVRYVGIDHAEAAPGVLRAIHEAKFIILAPSNPITSIGPILTVPGIRDALRATEAPIAAISPIVGGAAVSGPAAALMRCSGLPATCTGVTQAYGDFLDLLIADNIDRNCYFAENLRVHFCDTIMHSDEAKECLATETLGALAALQEREVAAP